jgi:transcriptional regulator with XRE-family HTH domain
MRLSEKLRYLRSVEGAVRGLNREMTQLEVVRAIRKDLGRTISQSYLSQIENGVRPHLTNSTRMLLARFFKVHPGYLVDDPEGFHTELTSHLPASEDRLDLWLIEGAERFRRDPAVSQSLLRLAMHDDTRKCLVLMQAILDTPKLVERLTEVLAPARHQARVTSPVGEARETDVHARRSRR